MFLNILTFDNLLSFLIKRSRVLILLISLIAIGLLAFYFYKYKVNKNLIEANIVFNELLTKKVTTISKLDILKSKDLILYNTYLLTLFKSSRDIKYIQAMQKDEDNSLLIKDYISYYKDVLNPSTAKYINYYNNSNYSRDLATMFLYGEKLRSKGDLFKSQLIFKELKNRLSNSKPDSYVLFLRNQVDRMYSYVTYDLKSVKK